MTGISADQAPTRSGAAQTIEPQEARDSTEVTICDIDTIVDFDIDNFSVSINVRNGVTGSLGDPATLKLVDQEEEYDKDLLPQAAAQGTEGDDASSPLA